MKFPDSVELSWNGILLPARSVSPVLLGAYVTLNSMPVLDRRPEEREPLAIVELRALDAVARALNWLGDIDAMVADHTVLVRQGAIGHAAALDEAFHVNAEQREAHQACGVDVVLERKPVVRGAPRVEVWIARRSALRNLEKLPLRGLLKRVAQLQSTAPLAEIKGHHVLGVEI